MSLRDFTDGYLEAMFWAETCNDGKHDCPVEDVARIKHLTVESRKEIDDDCAAFYDTHAETWREAGWNDDHAGHDFYLTRNGHGAGFWARGRGPVGEKLSDAARVYGTQGLDVDLTDPDAPVVYVHG